MPLFFFFTYSQLFVSLATFPGHSQIHSCGANSGEGLVPFLSCLHPHFFIFFTCFSLYTWNVESFEFVRRYLSSSPLMIPGLSTVMHHTWDTHISHKLTLTRIAPFCSHIMHNAVHCSLRSPHQLAMRFAWNLTASNCKKERCKSLGMAFL